MTDRLTRELAQARRRPRQGPSDKYTRAATASQMTDAELLDETRGLPVLRSRDTERDRVRHARLLEELRARLLQRNADLALYQDHAGRTFPRPLKFEPPTDEEREALAEALYLREPHTVPVGPQSDGTFDDWEVTPWSEIVTLDPEWAEAVRGDADAILAAGFRRQAAEDAR